MNLLLAMKWRRIVIGLGGLALAASVVVESKSLIEEQALERELTKAVAEYRRQGLPWTASDVLKGAPYHRTIAPTFEEAIDRVDLQAFRTVAPGLDDLANRHDYRGLENGLRPFQAAIGSAVQARPTKRAQEPRDPDFGETAHETNRWEALTAIGHLLRLEARLRIGQGNLIAGLGAMLADEDVASAFLSAYPEMSEGESLNVEVANLADTVEACLPCLQTSSDLKAMRFVLSKAPTPPAIEDLLIGQAYEEIPILRNADIFKLSPLRFEANRLRLRRDGLPKQRDDKLFLLGYLNAWTAADRAHLGSPVRNPSYEASLKNLRAKLEAGPPPASLEPAGMGSVLDALHLYTASAYKADTQIECVDLLIGALIQLKTTGYWPDRFDLISQAGIKSSEPYVLQIQYGNGTCSVSCKGSVWTRGEMPYYDILACAAFPPLPFKERTTSP